MKNKEKKFILDILVPFKVQKQTLSVCLCFCRYEQKQGQFFIFLRPIWTFACSKVLHISLLPHRIQELSTIDFQGKNHYLTSIGIPKKRGKYALWLQENREASR